MLRRTLLRGVTALVVAAVALAPVPAASARSVTTRVRGNWANADPCLLTEFDPSTGRFKCVGSSVWTGGFTGVTEFTVRGTLNLLTGDSSGVIDETFIGRSYHGISGRLIFTETFRVDGDQGRIWIHATIVRGSEGFEGSRGQVLFTGLVTPVGQGAGGYVGRWTRPAP